jgi:hypothetical protein
MSRKKNRYQKKARKKGFLSVRGDRLNTKGNIKNSSLETGKDVLIGVIGGGLVGAAIGKPSLIIGIATTGIGHYTGNKLVQILGLGMMAGGTFKSASVSGLNGMDGIKERLQVFKATLSDKFYMDKLKKKVGAAGIGELQYFTYPDSSMGELAALSDIERQIEESAMQFSGRSLSDDDIQIGIVDLDDRLI